MPFPSRPRRPRDRNRRFPSPASPAVGPSVSRRRTRGHRRQRGRRAGAAISARAARIAVQAGAAVAARATKGFRCIRGIRRRGQRLCKPPVSPGSPDPSTPFAPPMPTTMTEDAWPPTALPVTSANGSAVVSRSRIKIDRFIGFAIAPSTRLQRGPRVARPKRSPKRVALRERLFPVGKRRSILSFAAGGNSRHLASADHLAVLLPEGPWLYPRGRGPPRRRSAQITREKLFEKRAAILSLLGRARQPGASCEPSMSPGRFRAIMQTS